MAAEPLTVDKLFDRYCKWVKADPSRGDVSSLMIEFGMFLILFGTLYVWMLEPLYLDVFVRTSLRAGFEKGRISREFDLIIELFRRAEAEGWLEGRRNPFPNLTLTFFDEE